MLLQIRLKRLAKLATPSSATARPVPEKPNPAQTKRKDVPSPVVAQTIAKRVYSAGEPRQLDRRVWEAETLERVLAVTLDVSMRAHCRCH